MKSRHVLIFMAALLFGFSTLFAQTKQGSNLVVGGDLASALNSDDPVRHVDAYNTIVTQLSQSSADQKLALKAELQGLVMQTINLPAKDHENWASPTSKRNIAIALSGELKIESAIPRLIELLRPAPGEKFVEVVSNPFGAERTREGFIISPAAYALIKIGKNADTPLRAALMNSREALNDNSLKHASVEYKNRLIFWSNIKYVLDGISKQ